MEVKPVVASTTAKILTEMRHRIHHHHHPRRHHHSTGGHYTLHLKISQWMWTILLSLTGQGVALYLPRCPRGQVRSGVTGSFFPEEFSRVFGALSCQCCSAHLQKASRVSQSMHCSSGQYFHGSDETVVSPRLLSFWTAYWLGWPGCASQRSSNRLVCSEPKRTGHGELLKKKTWKTVSTEFPFTFITAPKAPFPRSCSSSNSLK